MATTQRATRRNGIAGAKGQAPRKKPEPVPVLNLSVAERAARGRAARSQASRSAQAAWQPPADRADPVEILRGQEATRVPELVPIRHGRMLVSPFTFYRGAAAVMAADLAVTPTAGLRVQLCGDAHLSNFGGFASPARELVFDVNDFDETAPGPFEWDVKRLAASIEIAARERGFGGRKRRAAVIATVGEYRGAMQRFAGMRDLDVWYAKLDIDTLTRALQSTGKKGKRLEKSAEKARTKDSMKALSRLTHQVNGSLRIISDPPLIVPLQDLIDAGETRDLEREMRKLIDAYKRTLSGAAARLMDEYHYADMARKVVGVGSVGTRCWIILMLGRDHNDPLFLQVKEATDSVLEPFAGKSRFANHGRRVVEGQWLMQSASDIMLGWVRGKWLDGPQRDFYVRQLWDWKQSTDIDTLTHGELVRYGRICGWSLALAHARSGDPIAIAAYLGRGNTFELALAVFADSYADQNERDFKRFGAAAKAGEIKVETGL
ncbi:MAG: DUF2252 domain-containing protein [Solirubrobacteraceae bacterium]